MTAGAFLQVARAVEALGCGEILLNCIANDGQNQGCASRSRREFHTVECLDEADGGGRFPHRYDLPLTRSVKRALGIPIVASSGAGAPVSTRRGCGTEPGVATPPS
jgi:glutamine amidotransferase/cyclase